MVSMLEHRQVLLNPLPNPSLPAYHNNNNNSTLDIYTTSTFVPRVLYRLNVPLVLGIRTCSETPSLAHRCPKRTEPSRRVERKS